MGWVWLIVILVLLFLAFHYWYITVAILAAGFAIYLIVKSNEEKKRREAEEFARLATYKAEQDGYRTQMAVLGEQSIRFFELIPNCLSLAEKYLDDAEADFADGAFGPFWDSIEKAAKKLGLFDEGIRSIRQKSSEYTQLLRKYDKAASQFPITPQSVAKLNVGKTTAERMKAIVRMAQRDFQFATIYEQRKTNQILVAGFTNLGEALDRMTWQITASIGDLAGSIEVMTSTLNESVGAVHSQLGDFAAETGRYHGALLGAASEQAARESNALDMLDNIQRGRRPTFRVIP